MLEKKLNILIKGVLLFSLFFISSFLYSAQDQTDSLLIFVKSAKEDTSKVNALNKLSQDLTNFGKFDEAKRYVEEALTLGKKLNFQRGIAEAYNNKGVIYESQGNYMEALKVHEIALEIRKKRGNKRELAATYNNIGNLNFLEGNNDEALKNYSIALKLKKETGNKKSLINAYNNIGNVYFKRDDFEKALSYFDLSLAISLELKNKKGIANASNNMGLVYEKQGKYTEAFKMYKELEKTATENNEKVEMAVSKVNISAVLIHLKRFPEAKKVCTEALQISKEMGSREYMKECFINMSLIDSAQGDQRGQLENYKLYVLYSDSLTNEENTRKVNEREIQYVFNKKAVADSIKNYEKVRLEELQHSKETREQNIYTYGGIIAFMLMLIIAVISFRAFSQKRKDTELIRKQKLIVEEKQKEILDSIHYAKRIQQSLLPSSKYFERNLKRLNK